ncbi:MAG TPA: glycosyltransferase family 39 protein [Solirubrobacteraceae bacterium]|nr:glycosyltransferase family 39 protein [Solirubrobacteraceae bacterium]
MTAITRGSSRRPSPRESALQLSDPTLITVAVLTVLTLALRFSQIHQGLYGDEGFTDGDIFGRSFGSVLSDVHSGGENSPPLFFLLAWATAKLGDPTVWIRLPSIILGSATVPVVYLIGRETVGPRAGLVAGAVIALSPFSFYYGVEARPYASMAFFVAVSTWALLRAVAGSGARWWALYVVAAAAAAYCHYTCIFVLIVQSLWSLWVCRHRIWPPLISAVVAVALYIPWLPKLRGKELGVIAALEPLTAHNVITDLLRPIAGYPYAPLGAIPTRLGLGLLIALTVIGFAACAANAFGPTRVDRARGWPRRFWLLFALALATPVGMLVYSEAATDLWLARGLYASVPAAALLLGALLVAIPKPANIAAIVIVLGILAVGAFRAASPSWRRPPTRSLAAYVDRETAPSDPFAVISLFAGPGIDAQLRRSHRFATLANVWRLTTAGGKAVVALDELTAKALHIPIMPPPPAGFHLLAHRRFQSAVMPLDVGVYRRSRCGHSCAG